MHNNNSPFHIHSIVACTVCAVNTSSLRCICSDITDIACTVCAVYTMYNVLALWLILLACVPYKILDIACQLLYLLSVIAIDSQ